MAPRLSSRPPTPRRSSTCLRSVARPLVVRPRATVVAAVLGDDPEVAEQRRHARLVVEALRISEARLVLRAAGGNGRGGRAACPSRDAGRGRGPCRRRRTRSSSRASQQPRVPRRSGPACGRARRGPPPPCAPAHRRAARRRERLASTCRPLPVTGQPETFASFRSRSDLRCSSTSGAGRRSSRSPQRSQTSPGRHRRLAPGTRASFRGSRSASSGGRAGRSGARWRRRSVCSMYPPSLVVDLRGSRTGGSRTPPAGSRPG